VSKTGKVVAIIVVVVLLGIGSYVLLLAAADDDRTPTTSQTPAPADVQQPARASIVYTTDGFSPADVSIKAGESIRITNEAGRPMQLHSDPHPQHTLEPELNVGTVQSGESMTFTLTQMGDWGYHDHLNPSMTGVIHVH
jgi:plastocyanin